MDTNKMQPLTHGSVLVVGTKASNMPQELRDNPRVIMWDSQDERWASKELPANVRAVFTTRFVGHSEFVTIMKESRKKGITIFPCQGTGEIIKMIRELLDVEGAKAAKAAELVETQETTMSAKGKLIPLVAYMDPTKSNKENAEILFKKSKELNIETNYHSIENLVWRKTTNYKAPSKAKLDVEKPKSEVRTVNSPTLDASVEILDSMIQRLTDMRQEVVDMRDFLVAVTEENSKLKKRIEKFKKSLDTDEEV